MVEAGTGSGSLSHAIARTIFPSGHLYTFDFHQERVRLANQEFQDHDLAQFITCQQKDVCEQGFDLKDTADAVFLDLPKPWLAIPFAYQALKTRGKCLCKTGVNCVIDFIDFIHLFSLLDDFVPN